MNDSKKKNIESKSGVEIKKFSDWSKSKINKDKKTKKEKDDEVLDSNAISHGVWEPDNKIVKIDDSEYEIVGINDISTIKPDVNEAMIINADLGNETVKRGDILWITTMLKKKNVNWNTMGVLKVRIVDMFNGLSILNTLR